MKKKIFVVDDEVEICEFLQSFFEERDYEVSVAHSGDQAMEAIDKVQPHIVLLDVQMPGAMDGLETLKWIKHKYPQIKVIMVTALETHDKIEKALRNGADNYITKPLSLEYLEKDVQDKIEHLANH